MQRRYSLFQFKLNEIPENKPSVNSNVLRTSWNQLRLA